MAPRRKLYPAMLTPMAGGGDRLDAAALGPMVDFLLERGADGVFILGTTGEGVSLDPEERRLTARLTRDALAGRGELLVHCGAQTTRQTVELAADAAAAEADGVAVIPPPYYLLTDGELEEHLAAAAAACAPTSFYVYAFSDRSGYPVPPRVVEQLRRRAPNLAGLKVSESPFERLLPYLGLGLRVFVGNEPLVAEAAATAEIAGSVSAVASVFPEAIRALLDDPNPERAAGVEALRAAMSRQPLIPTAKALLRGRGVPIGPDVRAPLRSLTLEEAEAARARTELLGAAAG
jgi:dihydrodipicolinate synthase/N-acetylneuraminate lyase